MLCPRPSRIRPRRAVTFLLLLIAAYHLSAFLFSPKQTPSRPSELSGHKGYLRAVDDGMYGYGHRGMVRDGIGDADEDGALDDDVTDEDTVVAEKIAVLRHDPDLLQQPSPSSLEIPPAYVLPEAANSIDGPDTQETPGEPHINERLNPAPRIKEGKKPGGPMESMRKAVVVTGPNAEQARRVRRLIRRYANTWYQRYVSHSLLSHTDPLFIFPLTDTTGSTPKQADRSVLLGGRTLSRRCETWRGVWRTRRVTGKERRWSSRRASSSVVCCTARQAGKVSGESLDPVYPGRT
jgi:hypothetical protein